MIILLESLAITALGIIGAIVIVFVFSILVQNDREIEIEKLEEEHQNRSHVENRERLTLLHHIRNTNDPTCKAELWTKYHKLEQCHQAGWNARVKEIVDLKVPYDEEVMASIQRGENPYRK